MSKCGIILWKNILQLLLIFQATSCYPIDKASEDSKSEPKAEIHYPNGTVVGKYSYKDNEGNPINVKYYADHSGYGVELNSFKTYKVIDVSTTKNPLQQPKPSIDYMKPMAPLLDLASEILSFNNRHIMDKTDANFMKDVGKVSRESKFSKIGNPDYETFYKNEVKAPKQCEKDKVRVYLVKEKRKIRSALGEDHGASVVQGTCEHL